MKSFNGVSMQCWLTLVHTIGPRTCLVYDICILVAHPLLPINIYAVGSFDQLHALSGKVDFSLPVKSQDILPNLLPVLNHNHFDTTGLQGL